MPEELKCSSALGEIPELLHRLLEAEDAPEGNHCMSQVLANQLERWKETLCCPLVFLGQSVCQPGDGGVLQHSHYVHDFSEATCYWRCRHFDQERWDRAAWAIPWCVPAKA